MNEPPPCPACNVAADYVFNKRVQGVSMQAFECAVCERQIVRPDRSRDELMSRLDAIGNQRAVSMPGEE
jgi:hypothetical protein